MIRIVIVLFFLMVSAKNSFAEIDKDEDDYFYKNIFIKSGIELYKLPDACSDKEFLCVKRSRFSAYEPNYAIFQNPRKDDDSIELHYSFRQLLTRPDCTRYAPAAGNKVGVDQSCLNSYDRRWEIFLSYTGEFDFYWDTRESDPVVNRLNNPAGHIRKYFDNATPILSWIDVALEHRSNGQTVSASEKENDSLSPNYGQYKAAVEFRDENYEYLDGISRSTNYVSIEGKMLGRLLGRGVKFYVKGNFFYFDNETDVFWGEYANDDVRLSDFDRYRFIASGDMTNSDSQYRPRWGMEWTVGDKGLETDSANYWLSLPLHLESCDILIPFYIRVHRGPLSEYSNYSESDNTFGIGLSFGDPRM